MTCDNCSDSFAPIKKTLRIVRAYCSDEYKDEFEAKEKDRQKSESAPNEKTLRHTVLPPGGYIPPDDKESISAAITRVRAIVKANNENRKRSPPKVNP